MIPPLSVWLDIGSRCGEFAILAATACQASKVIAVEFDPNYVEQLKLNVMRNRLHDIIDMSLLGYAPGSAPGYGALTTGPDRSIAVFDESMDLNPAATIAFAPMDQFLAGVDEIDAVNINVADPVYALESLKLTIARHKPALFVHGGAAASVKIWAQQNGYGADACQIQEYGDDMSVVAFIPLSRSLDAEIVNVA